MSFTLLQHCCARLCLCAREPNTPTPSLCAPATVSPLRIRSPTHQSFRLCGELYSFSYCLGCRCTLARQSNFRSGHSPLTSWSPENRLVPYVLLQYSSPAVYLDFRRCAHHILLRILSRCRSCFSPAVAVAVCYEPWYVTYLPGFSWSLPILRSILQEYITFFYCELGCRKIYPPKKQWVLQGTINFKLPRTLSFILSPYAETPTHTAPIKNPLLPFPVGDTSLFVAPSSDSASLLPRCCGCSRFCDSCGSLPLAFLSFLVLSFCWFSPMFNKQIP